MFTHSITIFRIFGIDVKVDASWLIIAVLLTWSLAAGVFPMWAPEQGPAVHWLLGAAGALGLFLSIILHELGHSLIARRHGVPVREITLFIFGGVADMKEEPGSPRRELLMAIAGPMVSVAISIILLGAYGVYRFTGQAAALAPAFYVILYLGVINAVVAGFNLIPAFPLDGGRVLRSVLWAWRGNLRWATRIASNFGAGFGFVLMGLGVISFIGRNPIGGVWFFILGLFVRSASKQSYQHVLIRRALEGESLQRFMKTNPVTAPSHISLRELVEEYVYKFHFKMFPVVEDGKLVGCVTTKQLQDVPREEWESTPVRALAGSCSDDNTISPDADPMNALESMSQSGNSRLMVVENGELKGVVTLKDMLEFLSLKLEFGDIERKVEHGLGG